MKGLTKLVMVLACLLLGQSSLLAQDFNALLQAVDKVEANLKTLVGQETAARQQESQKLREEIKGMQQAPGVASDNPVLAQLAQELQTLKQEVQRLASVKSQPVMSETALSSVVNDLELLKSEFAALRATSDQNQKMLASLDGEGFYVPQKDEATLDQIYQRLGTINDQLTGIKTSSNSDVNPARVGKGKISVYALVHEQFNDQSNERSTFQTRRGQLGVTGELNPYSRIKVIMDFAATSALQDAEFTLSPHPQWSFSFGQYKTPFGTDFLTGTPVMMFVNVPMANAIGATRDIGASMSYRTKLGKTSNVKLIAGVFNGSGINVTDVNSHKNFVFRSEFTLFNMFSFSPNVLAGKTNVVDGLMEELSVYGASLGWQKAKTQVMSEYTYGVAGNLEKAGWYIWGCQGLSTGWKFLPAMEFLTRYEEYDASRAINTNTLTRLTFGTNLLIDGKYTKIQLNYELDNDGDHLGEQARLVANFQASF
jgi:hypothetical protein